MKEMPPPAPSSSPAGKTEHSEGMVVGLLMLCKNSVWGILCFQLFSVMNKHVICMFVCSWDRLHISSRR